MTVIYHAMVKCVSLFLEIEVLKYSLYCGMYSKKEFVHSFYFLIVCLLQNLKCQMYYSCVMKNLILQVCMHQDLNKNGNNQII